MLLYDDQKQERNEHADEFLIKQELTKLVSPIQFTEEMKQGVLQKAKPSIWEREISLTIPIATFTILLAIGIGVVSMNFTKYIAPQKTIVNDSIVNITTGTFWESDIRGGQKR